MLLPIKLEYFHHNSFMLKINFVEKQCPPIKSMFIMIANHGKISFGFYYGF